MIAILKAILKMGCVMVTVYGKKQMKTVIFMKENMLMTKNVDTEYFNGRVEIYIKEIISKISDMDMGRCIG